MDKQTHIFLCGALTTWLELCGTFYKIFMKEKFAILNQIFLMFAVNDPIDKMSTVLQLMAW